ncbi:MAG: tetratricopeptide repeat protein, partial [Myxococcaceae bacterium]
MSEVRKGRDRSRAESSDRHETIQAEAFPPSVAGHTDSVSELHLKIARRLLAEGSPSRAYAELVRAVREAPMSPRLAASLVWLSLKAGTEAGALSLLRAGVDETEGQVRRQIRGQLIRLLRRLGENDQAREQLTVLLAENPSDRNARAVLNALLHRDQRWEELDASLEREAREALKRKKLGKAARATFWRARISSEGLANPGRAALRYGQTAQYLEQAHEYDRAFDIRLLWIRGLHKAGSPQRAIEDAIKQLRITADRVGKSARADALVKELGLLEAPASGTGQQRRVTQAEMIAAAEDAERSGKKAEAAAMLSAVVQDTEDSTVERKLEALYVRRGAWRELAQFYRERVKATQSRARKLDLLSRLAELLENELQDLPAAAATYGEMVSVGGDERALKEQVRLLNAREDRSGIRRALDKAVDQAAAPEAMANARVARAEAAIASKQFDKARSDLAEVLRGSPRHLAAHAASAELAAQTKDRAPIEAFAKALTALPRRHPERAEQYRR